MENEGHPLQQVMNLHDMTDDALRALRDEARAVLTSRLQAKERIATERVEAVLTGRGEPFTDDELVYSAEVRCQCGAGLAYPCNIGMRGAWHCADTLTWRALRKDHPDSREHREPLPFWFYDIKGEGHRGTTRPEKVAA